MAHAHEPCTFANQKHGIAISMVEQKKVHTFWTGRDFADREEQNGRERVDDLRNKPLGQRNVLKQ